MYITEKRFAEIGERIVTTRTERDHFDPNNFNHQLIVAGMTSCITDEGMTMHETLELLEDIKRQVAPALLQIQREEREKGAGA